MAMIDYGTILCVDGKFINKNQGMFMESSDTGYICKKAYHPEYKESYIIDGNYFVYAGDENFLVVFYKMQFYVIHHEKIIGGFFGSICAAETKYFDGLPNIYVEHLDKNLYESPLDSWGDWSSFVKEHWINDDGTELTGNEPIYSLKNGFKEYRRFLHHKKRCRRVNRNGGFYKYRTNRFLATWEYNGQKYEVIFGYGISNDEKEWEEISTNKDIDGSFLYKFTDIEIKKINGYFI